MKVKIVVATIESLAAVLPDTWCLDPVKVEAATTPKTKAIHRDTYLRQSM
jgi:dTDP-4-amino-4,6-dideoxygalactose transaminase